MTPWKLVGFLGLALAVALYVLHLKGEVRHAEKESTRFAALYHDEQNAHRLTVASYREAAAVAHETDAAHVLQVERAQAKVSQEVSSAYQTRLAELRARYDSLRVRASGEAPANTSGVGVAGVPEASDPAERPDDSASIDPFACEANTLQLGALQQWLIEQQAVQSP